MRLQWDSPSAECMSQFLCPDPRPAAQRLQYLAAASAFVSIVVMILSITISTMYNEVAGKKNMLGYETKQICKKKGKIITGDTC